MIVYDEDDRELHAYVGRGRVADTDLDVVTRYGQTAHSMIVV